MGEPARQRPLYPQLLPHARERTDGSEGRTDRRMAVSPSVSPLDPSVLQQRRHLSATKARLIHWLERYVPMQTSKNDFAPLVHGDQPLRPLYNARQFVQRYGTRLIFETLQNMTFHTEEKVNGTLYRDRHWQSEIISPAQYLFWQVKQLHEFALQEREDNNR